MKKSSKSEAETEILELFKDLKNRTPKEIRKIKRLAMKHNIKLRELKKKFCKKCFSQDLKIKSVRKRIKTVECRKCGNLMRWKIK